jgi:hypothetical protein
MTTGMIDTPSSFVVKFRCYRKFGGGQAETRIVTILFSIIPSLDWFETRGRQIVIYLLKNREV